VGDLFASMKDRLFGKGGCRESGNEHSEKGEITEGLRPYGRELRHAASSTTRSKKKGPPSGHEVFVLELFDKGIFSPGKKFKGRIDFRGGEKVCKN